MNHAKSSLAKTEIIKQIGYFPAFLLPAIDSSLIYDSLVQQTLFAYINNPLPIEFKEKLFIILSRHFGIAYFTICHSCNLRSLGTSAREILALGQFRYPESELETAADLEILQKKLQPGIGWQKNSSVEMSLLRCASLIFLQPQRTTHLTKELKKLLGTFYYHYLIVFLGYIKVCHQWLRSNPSITHDQDRRSQLHLGSLLLEEIQLAQFFQTDITPQVQIVSRIQPKIGVEQLVAANDNSATEVATPQLKQQVLTTCLADAPFPVMIHNEQGEIIHLNHNWLDVSGYDAGELLTLKQWQQKALVEQREIVKVPRENFNQLYHKYVAPARQTALEATNTLQEIVNSLVEIAPEVNQSQQIRASQKLAHAVRSEVTVATKTGEQLNWELYSTPLRFEGEADELTISIAKDITDVVHHENKLAEVEAKLRLVLEATKTGSWSWDLITNRVEICHRGRSILGLKDFDSSYQGFLQSIHVDERESIDLAIAKAIQAHQDLDIQYSVIKSEQEVAQIHSKAKLNYDVKGRPVSLTGVVIDATSTPLPLQQSSHSTPITSPITNSLVSQQIVQPETLTELKAIIDLLPYYLFVLDLETQTISLINSELADSFSLVKEEAIGKTIAECFSAKYTKQIAWIHQQVKTSQRAIHVREEVALYDGIHYFDTVVTPLYDRAGNISALLHTSSDIPDLAAAREALSQRTIQLEAANRELESFSYSVSHDLQAPLRVINGFSQVLWEKYQLDLDERGKHYLQRIQANSQRMSDLIDALLQLSRVTRSQMNSVNVNLSAIAEDTIEELKSQNPQRQLDLKIAPNLIAKGDPQLLRIVLSNLLNNAWKYTSKKSHTRIEFGVITESVSQPTYFVRDNGAGFDLEYADKLFTAFQRLHNQSEFPGTGIGLATVQRIIYRHGGKVWAEGECDRGATIYFSL